MSISYHTYLGPYAEVVHQPGTPNNNSDVQVDLLAESLCHKDAGPGTSWWFPNRLDRAMPRNFDHCPKYDGNLFLELSSHEVGMERGWFMTAYSLELSKLRVAYGEHNVRVCWGLALYTM